MRRAASLFLLFALLSTCCAVLWGSDEGAGVTADQALTALREGNTRYQSGQPSHPRADQTRMKETGQGGQHPVATIVSCSDSRVPVEILFDQGIGDVFVVRVAGNVCGVDEIGSAEYAVDHLGTPLVVVLGHAQCGAVTAAATDAPLHGSIRGLVDKIRPAVEKAQKDQPDLHGKDLVRAAIEANVWQSIEDLLKHSAAIRERVRAGKLKVLGAIYDLETGEVRWLGEHRDTRRLASFEGEPGERHGESTTATHND